MMKLSRLIGVLLLCAAPLAAKVTMPAVFGSGMVLQRNEAVPVWGKAAPGEGVTVEVRPEAAETAGKKGGAKGRMSPAVIATASAQADAEGAWRARLPSMKAGGPYTLFIYGAADTTRFTNVMVGEVWLCAGQSNMEFSLKKTEHAQEDIAAANNPRIRLFTVKHKIALEPQADCTGSWSECSPATAENFSAVAYFFAREIEPKVGCAVGLILSSWGGTPVEAWTPNATLASRPEFASILETWQGYYKAYPEEQRKFALVKDSLMKKYDADVLKAQAEHTPLPRRPAEPRGPGHRDSPSGCYNGMIAPVAPFALRGVLWYQGEANATRALQYRSLFPAMINDWRTLWGKKEMPFLFVQLPNLIRTGGVRQSEGWTMLREAQFLTLQSVAQTGMAVTIDIGDSLNIHPTNKRDVGHRLALWARAMVYGEKGIEYSGPLYQSVAREGSKMRVRFTHTKGGLRAGRPAAHAMLASGATAASLAGQAAGIEGFAVAGADSVFYPAQAEVKGAEVVVWSEKVKAPLSVRYGWKDNAVCNLYNGAGLPASTFRTDAIDRPEMHQPFREE